MKIVVAVKQVAALDEEFELVGSAVDPEYIEWELNEWDLFSLEAALQLRESDGGEIVVVTVGPDDTEEALLACLARGADRAVRIWEESLANADVLAVARVLAAVIEQESPDLVLFGVQASDSANGSTGPAVAGYLDMPCVAVVKALSHDAGSSSMTVERELEGGLIQALRITLPAVLTIQTGINEPRYANLRAIKQARQKPLDSQGLAAVGLEPSDVAGADGAQVTSIAMPDGGAGAEIINGSPAETAARILEIVKERVA